MKIRSITYFVDPGWPIEQEKLKRAAIFIREARQAFVESGYAVQTTRLASIPFSRILMGGGISDGVKFAKALESTAREFAFDYISIGPTFPHKPEFFAAIPEILENTESVFVSGMITDPEEGISLKAVWECAEVIRRNSQIFSDGFANLRFAGLASVGPGAPFLPAAYHSGEEPVFALALEAADLAVQAVRRGSNPSEVRHLLITSIEKNAAALTQVGDRLAKAFSVRFTGIDFSLAPYPEVDLSIGTAIEELIGTVLGSQASLTGVGFFAEAINRARFRRVGFSGVMLPVLEDVVLARRVAEGYLNLSDLLLYSAVCGTGLDTIPLPGEIASEAVAAILFDLGTLSLRLNKPLTARLMPIPGKKAGEDTNFSFPYFANSKVMTVDRHPLLSQFKGDSWLPLGKRRG